MKLSAETENQIARLLKSNNKIGAIKLFREISGCDLKTAKESIEAFQDNTTLGKSIATAISDKNRFQEAPENLSSSVQEKIDSYIRANKNISAIKAYREATGCDLKTAKQRIEALSQGVSKQSRSVVRANSSNVQKTSVFAKAIILLCLLTVIDHFFLKDTLINLAKNHIQGFSSPEKEQSSGTVVINPDDEYITVNPDYEHTEKETSVVRSPPAIPEDTPMDLQTLYQQKLANTDYVYWKSLQGLPKGFQSFIEEYQIKYVRSQIARAVSMPPGQMAIHIPVSYKRVTIDGRIHPEEWQDSKVLKLAANNSETTVYLRADSEWLYLACDVPGDTTRRGFDQFRFYIHVNLDPVIKNERIHVGSQKLKKLGGIRQTSIRWQGEPATSKNENWKKYPISDWQIYQYAVGASSMNQHRQFEAKMNLAESGLHAGIPFTSFIEVETDPLRENGKFKKRQYLGELGSQKSPVWMVIR